MSKKNKEKVVLDTHYTSGEEIFNNKYVPVNHGKRPHLWLGFAKAVARIFVRKPEVVWKTEIPSEPCLFVCNHTKNYAPVAILLYYKNVRLWANFYFMYLKDCWNHMMKKVLKDRNPILKGVAALIMPLVVWTFKSIEAIPVFHDTRVKYTFTEFVDTLNAGKCSMVFPERTENQVSKYVYEFNRGFTFVAQTYFKQTGKLLKFYPVYCCQSLKKFVVGEPITYNPDEPMRAQSVKIAEYLQNEVTAIADSLGEHDIVLYG